MVKKETVNEITNIKKSETNSTTSYSVTKKIPKKSNNKDLIENKSPDLIHYP